MRFGQRARVVDGVQYLFKTSYTTSVVKDHTIARSVTIRLRILLLWRGPAQTIIQPQGNKIPSQPVKIKTIFSVFTVDTRNLRVTVMKTVAYVILNSSVHSVV